jgi:hypothetical protein
MVMTPIFITVLSAISSWASPPETAVAPPPNAVEALPSEDAKPAPPGSYAKVVADLEEAIALNTADPAAGNGSLANALLALIEHAPALAADRNTLMRRVDAMLQLARSQLPKTPNIAAQTMDEAIRQAHGDSLPAASYGPRLEALYQERLAVMNERGTAELEIDCTIRCRVYIDGHEEPIVSGPLHLGAHNVWVEDISGVYPPLRSVEVLSVAGKKHKLSYGPHMAPRPAAAAPGSRVAPLWVEITMLTMGVAMLVGGTTALALHQDCPEPNFTYCKNFDGRALGGALIGIGGVSLGAGSVMLSVDRRRDVQNDSLQAMLVWQRRF